MEENLVELYENSSGGVTVDDFTHKNEEKKEELEISNVKKKKNKDEHDGLVDNYFNGEITLDDITHTTEEKERDLLISELEKKRKKDEEDALVNDFFSGKLTSQKKRKMTCSDMMEFAFSPLPLIPYTRALHYLHERSKVVPALLSDLSKLQKELNAKGSFYGFEYEDYLLKHREPGYFEFIDDKKERSIYVCTNKVGRSLSFQLAKNIENFVCVSGPKSKDTNFELMTKSDRNWFRTDIRNVANLLHKSNGNAVLSCKGGRSRSPTYLVVYLVLCYNMSIFSANSLVATLLLEARQETLDRDNRFVTFVSELINGIKKE